MMQTEDRSLKDLLGDLTGNITTLFRKEIQLARAETSEKISQVGYAIGSIAGGGILALAALIVLLQALVIGITEAGVPAGWAALIVGVVVAAIAYGLIHKGTSDLKAEQSGAHPHDGFHQARCACREGASVMATHRDESGTDPGSKSAAEIEREVRDSRADVERTLDQIQERLSPGQLIDQAVGYLRGGGGEFVRNLGDSVRSNPLPVTLVGVGLAWMMLADEDATAAGHARPIGSAMIGTTLPMTRTPSRSMPPDRCTRRPRSVRPSDPNPATGRGIGERMSEVGERASELGDRAKEARRQAAGERPERGRATG